MARQPVHFPSGQLLPLEPRKPGIYVVLWVTSRRYDGVVIAWSRGGASRMDTDHDRRTSAVRDGTAWMYGESWRRTSQQVNQRTGGDGEVLFKG